MVNNWDDFFDNLRQINKEISKASKEIAERQQKLSENLTEILLPINTKAKTIKDAFLQIASFFFLPSILSKYSELTKRGWYISPSYFKFIDGADESIFLESKTDGFELDYSELEIRIHKNFSSYLEIIHIKANEISIKRKPIFKELFILYRKKMYNSLIPLALAQVDGLSKDNFGIGFYNTEHKSKKNENKTRQKIGIEIDEIGKEEEYEDLASIILLFSQIDFNNKNDLVLIEYNIDDKSQLNRHAILHGESVEYGTKTNAIKALLLLDFVLDLINFFKKKKSIIHYH